MFGRRHHGQAAAPLHGSVVVPVLAPVGGAGRSTLTALLSEQLSHQTRTLVVDVAGRSLSPWPGWVARSGGGTASLFAASDSTRRGGGAGIAAGNVHAACSRMQPDDDAAVVLTDTRSLEAPPLEELSAHRWLTTAALTGRRVVLVDTATALLPALVARRHTAPRQEDAGGADAWLRQPAAQPVLCVPNSAKGLDDALATITQIEHLGLGGARIRVVITGIALSDLPRRVLAALTLLDARVASITVLPHDRRLQAGGTPQLARADRRTRRAVASLAERLTALTPSPAAQAADRTNRSAAGLAAGPRSPESRRGPHHATASTH